MRNVSQNNLLEVNWVVMPTNDGRFQVTLTGVVGLDFVGANTQDFTRDTVRLDMSPGGELEGLLATVLGFSGVNPDGGFLALTVDQWAQYSAPNTVYQGREAQARGFGVDLVEVIDWDKNGIQIGRNFGGLDMAVAAQDADLIRVGFQVTLLGRIRAYVPEPRKTAS